MIQSPHFSSKATLVILKPFGFYCLFPFLSSPGGWTQGVTQAELVLPLGCTLSQALSTRELIGAEPGGLHSNPR